MKDLEQKAEAIRYSYPYPTININFHVTASNGWQTLHRHPGHGLTILDPLHDGRDITALRPVPAEEDLPDSLLAALGEELRRVPRAAKAEAGLAVGNGDLAAQDPEQDGTLARLIRGPGGGAGVDGHVYGGEVAFIANALTVYRVAHGEIEWLLYRIPMRGSALYWI
ncbi:unnamed protein product [Clonostachys rosea]|uniref:Uncharacterized protein n=1 Tax=Bionectria ochroleuca TaxID=29856 RepID=A0ABY6UZA0_BIOOC|nr:unnamed protein product [Clonostachys rosea]